MKRDCCKYTAGMLKDAVVFERLTQVRQPNGGFSKQWEGIPGAPSRGMFTSLSGREVWQAQRVQAETRNRLVVRWFAGLTAADRARVRGKVYAITYVPDVDRRDQWLEIELAGGVAA